MNSELGDYIIKKAAELYTTEEEQERFLDGFLKEAEEFLKEAGVLDRMNSSSGGDKHRGLTDHISKGTGEGFGRVVGMGAAGLGVAAIAAAYKAVSNSRLQSDHVKALNEAIQINRILKQAASSEGGRKKIVSFGNTIFRFAPHIATDAHLLASILANAIHGEGIDPMTIRTLTELESRYRDTQAFSPKNWV